MEEIIKKASEFILSHFEQANASEVEKRLTFEHLLRTAKIGLELAKIEQANSRVVVLGCLFHSVGMFDTPVARDHGKISAQLARKFLDSLSFSEKEINDVCYGIEVHISGEIDYEYDHIKEAKIIADSDNIDRYGPLRIHEMIEEVNQYGTIEEKTLNLEGRLSRLRHYYEGNYLETESGNFWFKKQLKFGIESLENYLHQLLMTNYQIEEIYP